MNDLTDQFGIIYCATGRKHMQEAVQSVRQSRKIMPNVGYSLFTDAAQAEAAKADFDHVFVIEKPAFHYDDKIEAMVRSPYPKTLFVDTDTWLIEPLYELIDLLDNYDLAYTHELHRGVNYEPDCPECFAEPCTAVMAFRKNEVIAELWQAWRTRYDWEKTQKGDHPLRCLDDQGAFRHVLYHRSQKLSAYVLPAEYNLRVYCQWFAGGVVKLLHGRDPHLTRALRANVNRDAIIRTGDGMRPWERAWFNLKRRLKIQLKKTSTYDFRLRGIRNCKPVSHYLPDTSHPSQG